MVRNKLEYNLHPSRITFANREFSPPLLSSPLSSPLVSSRRPSFRNERPLRGTCVRPAPSKTTRGSLARRISSSGILTLEREEKRICAARDRDTRELREYVGTSVREDEKNRRPGSRRGLRAAGRSLRDHEFQTPKTLDEKRMDRRRTDGSARFAIRDF